MDSSSLKGFGGKITLFRGWHASNQYVWSPFVTKVEFQFRLNNVRYTVDSGSPTSAPKGKIPYIAIEQDNDAPIIVADSALIIKRFINSGDFRDLNASLEPADKTHDLAIRALLEDKLYHYGVCVHSQRSEVSPLIGLSSHESAGSTTTMFRGTKPSGQSRILCASLLDCLSSGV